MNENKRILIFHGGSIGDTLMALPAMQCIRDNYPESELDLFSCPGVNDFSFLNFYSNMNIFDNIYKYYTPVNKLRRLIVYFRIYFKVFMDKYDMVFCLLPWYRNKKNDVLFFKLAGVKKVVYPATVPMNKKVELPTVPVLFSLGLKQAGLIVPKDIDLRVDLKLTLQELEVADIWLKKLKIPKDCTVIAVGMGGKKPACRWPVKKYKNVLEVIVEKNSIWPIFFGGSDDSKDANEVIQYLGRGTFAGNCGKLSLRETVAVMTKCKLFLGNDTGTIHMAAAANIPIVGIYSDHNYRGLWHPHSNKAKVFRLKVECGGCDEIECPHGYPAKCIDGIDAKVVAQTILEML